MITRRVIGAFLAAGTNRRGWSLRAGAACASLTLHAGGIIGTVALAPTSPATIPGIPALEVTLEVAGLPGEGQQGLADAEPHDTPVAPAQDIPDEVRRAPEPPSNPDPDPAPIAETASPPELTGKAEVHETSAFPATEASLAGSEGTGDTVHPDLANPGAGRNAERDLRKWEKRLLVHLNRFKRYPGDASQATGEVTLTFTLDRSGHIVSAAVRRSSGDPAFDQAALGMMLRSDPVPRPPAQVTREGLIFTVPVTFRSRKPGR